MAKIPAYAASGLSKPTGLTILSYTPSNVLDQRLNTLIGQSPSLTGGYPAIRSNVNRTVEQQIFSRLRATELKRYQFPVLDFPKYNFTLIENDVNYFGGLTPEKIYKLPLPSPLVDAQSVLYKQNFSYLNAIKDVATFFSSFFGPGAQAIVQALTNVDALINTVSLGSNIVNTFKSVTLDSPQFRQFELNWKLIPRNYRESRELQSLLTSLKRGSSPKFANVGTTVSGLFSYPKVYTMFFQPNVQFLYKFKPAVLLGLTIHYDGGGGAPAFYKPENDISENSPPESIIINTTWLELEYWKREDYKDDPNIQGMPSPNPLDALDGIRQYEGLLPTPQPVGAFEGQLAPGEFSNLPGTNQ